MKRTNHRQRKLDLKTETIKELKSDELQKVVGGGMDGKSATCSGITLATLA